MVINTRRIRKINIIVETRVILGIELTCVVEILNLAQRPCFFLYLGLRIEDGLGSKLFCNAEIAMCYCLFLVLFLIVCLFRMVVTTKQCLLRRNKCSALTV